MLLTTAIELLELCHRPPDVVSVKEMVSPTQTVEGPEMLPTSGSGFIDIVLDEVAVPQLLLTVYVIVSMPGDRAVINPVMPIEADELLLSHVPPVI